MSPTITDGVFFATPPPLPRGRHSLSRDDIVAAQRERLLIAAAELVGTDGYRGFGIRELCRTASVSQSVFYEHFTDKDDCVFGVYRRFIDVIVTRMRSATPPHDDWAEYLEAFIATYLDALNRDRLVARACIVEMDALGAPGRELRRASIRRIAAVMLETWAARHPSHPDALTLDAFVAVTNMIRHVAADALDATPDLDLRNLAHVVTPLATRALTPPLTD